MARARSPIQSTFRRLSAVALVAATIAGCGIIKITSSGGGGSAGPSVSQYRGAECNMAHAIKDEDERLAVMLACGQGTRMFGYHVGWA
jgi:hypothetical protein